MSALLFYQQIRPLDRVKHQSLYFDKSHNLDFAAKSNLIPILASEIPLLANQLPMVFIPAGKDEFALMVLTSVQKEMNSLIVNGAWQGRYIPAFIRRYPFITVGKPSEPDQFVIAIDEQASCLYADPKKTQRTQLTPLFEGEKLGSDLQERIPFLQKFHQDNLSSFQFYRKLHELNLLTKSDLSITGSDQKKYLLNGVYLIDEKKLRELSHDAITALFQDDLLSKIYLIIASLQNFPKLSEAAPHALPTAKRVTTKKVTSVPKVPVKKSAKKQP